MVEKEEKWDWQEELLSTAGVRSSGCSILPVFYTAAEDINWQRSRDHVHELSL